MASAIQRAGGECAEITATKNVTYPIERQGPCKRPTAWKEFDMSQQTAGV